MSILTQAKELLENSDCVSADVRLLSEDESYNYIQKTMNKFKPEQYWGHLCIGKGTILLPIDIHEFSYTNILPEESGYIFFEQTTETQKRTVVWISDIRQAGTLFENSFGMEYFLSNENSDYLIAVNWYVVEISGEKAEALFEGLPGMKRRS